MGAAMLSVQVGASLAKSLFPAVGAQGATALRVTLAALILAAVLRPWRVRASEGWKALAAYGLSLGLMNLLFYAALQRIPLGVAVAVEFAGPLGVAVAGSRRRLDFAWIGLAAVGLLALAPLQGQSHPLDPLGLALALAAGGAWAGYIVSGRRAGQAHGAQATALGMAIAALIVLPFGVAQAGAGLLAPAVLPTALGVAVLSSVLPYTLEMFALTRIPTRVFGTLMSLEPAVAAVAGALILHEALSLRQTLAIATIMAASLGAALTLRAAATAAAPVGVD